MNKPDDIPQDVWDAAILYSGVYAEPAGETLTDLRMDFARAIMAAKAEERSAILDDVSMIAGMPVDTVKGALSFVRSAIIARGTES